MDRQPNFRPRLKAREAEDGGRLLGFYMSEAKEEIRSVGFVNHQSTGNLWRHVGQWPPRVVVRVSKNGDKTLGFCILEAKEEICGIGFAKWLRKTNRSQGRLILDGVTVVIFYSSDTKAERPCGGGEVAIVLNWTMVCLVDQFGSRDGEGRDKRDEKYWVFPNRWIILYTCVIIDFKIEENWRWFFSLFINGVI